MSLSDILIMNAARLVGVLELPGRLKLRVTKGRNGEWRIRGCLRIIQVGYEKVVTTSDDRFVQREYKHSNVSSKILCKKMGLLC